MRVIDFKKLLPNSIAGDTLVKKVDRVHATATFRCKPTFKRMAEIHDGKVSSREAKDILDRIKTKSSFKQINNLFGVIVECYDVIGREANVLSDALDSKNIEFIMRDALKVKEAHILQFVMVSEQFIELTRTLGLVIQELEIQYYKQEPIATASLKYIERNLTDKNLQIIGDMITFFNKRKKEPIIEKIYDLPDIDVDESVLKTIESTEGRSKVDPAGLNPLSLLNPLQYIYVVNKSVSELRQLLNEREKNELEILEYRHRELILLKEGKHDPSLAKRIEKHEDKIQALRASIKRAEERMG